MPTFVAPALVPPVGPRPETYEGFHAGDAGPSAEYVASIQNRKADRYRGSYSYNASAADQAGPGVEFAPSAQSRATPPMQGRRLSTFNVFDTNKADTWAASTSAKSTPLYRPPGSSAINSADQAGAGLEYAPRADSTPMPFYNAPTAQTISAFTATLDAWVATTFGRSIPFYAGSRPITIPVFDPATNTFADWTPAALLSRALRNYKPPATQPQVAWGSSIVTDQIAAVAMSRSAALYRAPAGFLARVYDQPFVPSTTDFVASILSRQQPYYRNYGSSAINSADQAGPGLEWTTAILSRRSESYRAPAAYLARVYDQPAVGSSADYAALIRSRPQGFYRGSYSAFLGAADQDAAAPDGWTQTIQSRRSEFYRAPLSALFASWDDHACTTLTPDTLLLPDSVLFPDLCAQVELAFVTKGRVVEFYRAPLSQIRGVFTPTIFIPDTWAPSAQSRRLRRGEDWRSLAIPVYDPAANTFADWTPGVIQSRSVAFYSAHSLLALIWDGASGVLPGGGGYGAVMGEGFFGRYHGHYEARYKPRYKPTIRKQKG